MCELNPTRKAFLITAVLVVLCTIAGIVSMTVMEHQARAALPREEQTAEAISSIYDGAVCLGCDFARIGFAMIGSLSFILLFLVWGLYEAGRSMLIKLATPKSE